MISKFMLAAINEAKRAAEGGEVPVGAVIVKNGEIISRGFNEKEGRQDATLHAEITAIKNACSAIGSWRLDDCDMYVTLEPCSMCAGAIIQARLKRVYIGCMDLKAGAAGSVVDLFCIKEFNHHPEVYYGIMEDECSVILKMFFQRQRE